MADYSIKQSLIQLFDLPIAVAKRFRSDRLTRHAAALSFSSLLALAPMVAIAFAMLSLFSSFEQLGSAFEEYIYSFLLPAAGQDLQQYIEQFAGQAGKLTVIGLVFFLLTALLLLFTIEESFNDIWRIKKGRSMTARVTVYWALVSLGPLLMGASLTISTYILSLTVAAGAGFADQVQSLGVVLLPFLFQILAFLLLYLVMPNVRVSLSHAFCGAFVAAVLFELTKRGFGLYIVNFGNYEVVYGALSTLPIFLIWIYLSWVVALVGAEVVAELQQRKSVASLERASLKD
ncbi:MAG: YihY family inner membrane protein [Arenicella sp.]|nr:YihY family inner membrane protein [Arenicella sp.]